MCSIALAPRVILGASAWTGYDFHSIFFPPLKGREREFMSTVRGASED